MSDAVSHHTSYSGHKCECVAGSRASPRPLGKEYLVRTVTLGHFRAALLAAAGGLLAAVGLLVVPYAQPAEANYPGKSGKIAYTGYDGNDPEIYTIKTDGGSKLQLTDNGEANDQPAYSPGGKRIAFAGYDGSDFEIYTIKSGGGGKRQVTDNTSDDRYPYYSPSGKRIAYAGFDGDESEIYTIKPDGGGKLRVTDNSTANYSPYWGPQ
jgi:hypothetical protein